MITTPIATYSSCLRHSLAADGSCSVAERITTSPKSASATAVTAKSQLKRLYQGRSIARVLRAPGRQAWAEFPKGPGGASGEPSVGAPLGGAAVVTRRRRRRRGRGG